MTDVTQAMKLNDKNQTHCCTSFNSLELIRSVNGIARPVRAVKKCFTDGGELYIIGEKKLSDRTTPTIIPLYRVT